MNYSQSVELTNPTTINIEGTAPFTLTIMPSTISGLNKIRKIEYLYGDGTSEEQVLFPANSANYNGLPYPLEPGDPRNYNKVKTFYVDSNNTTYTTTINVYQIAVSSPSSYTINVSLSAPYLENISGGNGYFEDVHLKSTRMYGVDNRILYVFESSNPNYLLPVNVDWKLRPQAQAEAQVISSYRAYKLLEPYENEISTSIDTVTHIGTVGEVAALPNPDPGIPWDIDALNYFSRVGNISEENKLIINNFIIQLKDNDLWDSLLEAWLLSEEYNIGSGSEVASLINPTNKGTLLGTISPTWENTGIRFYEGYIAPNPNASRMEIQNWIYPPQRAPMSIACVYTPFSSPKPGGDPSPVLGPGACLFGQTSLGGGPYQHFGINYGFALSAVDGYYGSNTIENGTFMFNITGGPNGPYYMSSMIAASGGPAYFYTNDKSHLFTSNYNSNAALSAVAFSYSMGGVTVNQEFDGIICAGFVFSSSINYSKFYSIYKSTIGQNITFAGYP
jgi:hypothetical protein